jgi:aspartate racemase
MKTIGMIGGLSWHSTLDYYRAINQEVQRRLGGRNAARIILRSLNFAEVEKLMIEDRWDLISELLVQHARELERSGADFLLICANTAHKSADAIENGIRIPLLHIADATAEAIKAAGFSKVCLLATKYTMGERFYLDRLKTKHGIEALVPNSDERNEIHHIIHDEIMSNLISDTSRARMLGIMERLSQEGARGAILGCTEIPLLIRPEDTEIPLFDTAQLH